MNARILVTGGNGYIGHQVVNRLASLPNVERVISVDLRPGPQGGVLESLAMDVRDPSLADVILNEEIERVVHLAAVVTPKRHHTRQFLHSVDVGGTFNVIKATAAGGARHLTVMSSGAAYGYHPDNPEWIDEHDELRGNPEFAYSDHKRMVEELMAETGRVRPELAQLVLRPGTILGPTVDNQITALFERPVVLGIAGSPTPFVFIWDADVVDVIVQGTLNEQQGAYNLAGDGVVPLRQIAAELGKPYVPLPAWLVKSILSGLRSLHLTALGPEQVDFLRYRPVLANRRLKEEFGYVPTRTSIEAFRGWMESRGG